MTTSCISEEAALRILRDPEGAGAAADRAHVAHCETCRGFVAALARVMVPPSSAEAQGWGEAEGFIAPGTRLGDYVIESILGRGGMGVVYAGRDTRLDRPVAIKLLREDVGTRRLEWLRREAATMAKLSHPNVAQVFDIGDTEHGPFVVMERIDGITLRRWQEQPRTSEETLSVYAQAAEGLAAAHARGIVHRDFKPSNAMISESGTVKVLDFGLATVTEGPASSLDCGRTSTLGGFGGTPRYAAPEQLEGRVATEASDQFSFCAVLFEALCGELPYPSESVAQRRTAHLRGDMRPVTARVRPHVQRALVRGLRVDPSRRFGSMRALLRALARPRRAWVAWAGGAAVLAAGLAAWPSENTRCADGRERMQQAWVRPRPASWTDRPELLGQANRLDAYVDAWLEVRAELCVGRAAAPAQFEAGVACMERLASRLEVTGQTLLDLGVGDTPLPSNLLGRLEEPSQCLGQRTEGGSNDVLSDEYEAFHARAVAADADGEVDPAERLRVQRLGQQLLSSAEDLGDTRVQGRVVHTLAVLAMHAEDYGEAERRFEEAFFAAGLAGDTQTQLDICENLVTLLAQHFHEAERAAFWAGKATEIADIRGGDEERGLAALLNGWVAITRTESTVAIEHFDQAQRLLSDEGRIRSVLDGRAQARLALQQWDLARVDLEEAIRRGEQNLGVSHPYLAGPVNTLATLEIMENNFDEAARLLERAVTLTPKEDRLRRVSLRGNLALLLRRQKKFDRALELFQEIRREFAELLGPEHIGTIRTELAIVETLTDLGRTDESRREVQRLLDRGLPDEFMSRALFARASVSEDPRPDLERILTLPNESQSTLKIAREALASLDSAR